jgi:ABC-2 type transport system permease protein
MSSLGNILFKEIKELMTPATFLPIIIIALVFGSMGGVIGGIEEEYHEPPTIALINSDNGKFSQIAANVFNQTSDVQFYSSDINDKNEALSNLKEKEGVALLVINQNFSSDIENGKNGTFEIYWVMQGGGILDSLSSSVVESLINFVDTSITKELISRNNGSINTTFVLNPTIKNETTYFKDKELKGISPGEIAGFLSQQSTFIPIIMMMIIIMAGQIVISSMALEKENKTLETLLTLPVKRTSIVAGKIIAAAIVGLILVVIYMFGMSGYLSSTLQFETLATGASSFDLSLNSIDMILIGVVVFVSLVAALALCMFLGTLAKNFKSAQTLTFPIAVLVIIPMLLTMFKDFDTLPLTIKALLFGIPFSHPMMAPRALLFGDYLLVFAGLIYVSIFALIMIFIVVWVFKTDRIVTGTTKFNLNKIFKKKLNK